MKKKPLTVFVEFPNKQNVSMSDRNRGHDKVTCVVVVVVVVVVVLNQLPW